MAAFFPANRHCYSSAEPGFTSLFRLLDDFDSYSRSQTPGDKAKHARPTQIPTFQPKFDIRETDKAYELHGELAGMKKEHVQVEFSDPQTMIVRGRIERSYAANTPSAGAITNAPSATTAGAIEEPRPATPTSASGADNNNENGNTEKASIHKATVEDDTEDEEGYAKVSTPTSEIRAPSTAVAESAKPVPPQVPTTTDTAKYWVRERSIGEFSRSFNFPQRVDHDGVSASLDNGVLTITVPKAKRHEVRRIAVQ